MTSPDPKLNLITPLPNVHLPPREVPSVRRLTARQVGVAGGVIVDLILAQVAFALGSVSVLGVKPFDFLNNWGTALQIKAQEAYQNGFAIVDVANEQPIGTTQSGTLNQVYSAAAAVQLKATTADLKADTASGNIQTTWNNLFDASYNTTGSTNITVEQVKTAQAAVRQTATTADGKSQDTIDGIFSAIQNGVYTNMPPTVVFDSMSGLTNTSRSAMQSNLVIDSGGENAAYWKAATQPGVSQSNFGKTGNYSVQLTSAGVTARTLYFNTIETGAINPYVVRTGEIYEVTCYVYSASLGTVELVAQTNNSTVTALQSLTITNANKNTWMALTKQYVIPAGAVVASFGIRLNTNAFASGATVLVDDMVVREITNAQAAQSTANTTSDNLVTTNGNVQSTWDSIWSGVYDTSATGKDFENVRYALLGLAQLGRGTVQSGTNLLADPGGEKAAFWTGQTGVAQVSVPKRSGSFSVQLTSGGSTARTLYFNTVDTGAVAPFAARPTEIYHVECYIYSATTGTVQLVAQSNGSTVHVLGSTTSSAGWSLLAGDFTVGTGVTTLSFGIRLTSNAFASGTTVLVDDMLVREITDGQLIRDSIWNGLYQDTSTGKQPEEIKDALSGFGDLVRGNVASGANLIADPGAERPAFWAGGQTGVTHSGLYKRNGSYSALLTSAGATERTLYFNTVDTGVVLPISVRANEFYEVECYIYAPGGAGGNNGLGTVELIAKFGNANPVVLDSETITSGTKGTWLLLSGTYAVTAAGSMSFGIRLAANATTSSDRFFVDDMSVRENAKAKNAQDAADGAQSSADTAQDYALYVSSSNNLVIDPDFEDTTIRRIGGNTTLFSAQYVSAPKPVQSGNSLELKANSTTPLFNFMPVQKNGSTIRLPVTPGMVIKHDVYVHAASANGGAGNLQIYYAPADVAGTTGGIDTPTSVAVAKGTWQRLSGQYTVPEWPYAGAEAAGKRTFYITVGFRVASCSINDLFYLDRVFVYR